MIQFVRTSEGPTPIRANFRAGTRSTSANNSKHYSPVYRSAQIAPHRQIWSPDGVEWSLPKSIMVLFAFGRHSIKVAPLNPKRQRIRSGRGLPSCVGSRRRPAPYWGTQDTVAIRMKSPSPSKRIDWPLLMRNSAFVCFELFSCPASLRKS